MPKAANLVLEYAPPLPGFPGWVLKRIPALDSLRRYSWRAFGGDLVAGLTVATVAVPQAMAYALLAGVDPQYGLYTAIVMTAVGALLDSSRQLINGPTNAISIALFSALAVIPDSERIPAAVLLGLLVGLTQVGIALLHLGDLTRYVSHSVIVGFTTGAGTLIILDQFKSLVGLQARGGGEDHFLKRFWLTLTTGGSIHWPTVGIGVGTMVIVLSVRHFNDFCRRRGSRIPIPQHMVGIIVMGLLVWGFALDQYGVQIVAPIPAALPEFEVPSVKWDHLRLLASNAFAIAILGLLEAVAMAKAIANYTGQKLDINQQVLSEGAANLTGSFFQCIPGSGSLTRSVVNQQAGAVSQWSGVICAIAVAATVLLFAPLAQYIPRASLAGLLVLAAFRMMDHKQLFFHMRATKFDAGVVIATAIAAVAISVEYCIVIGVFLSFVLYVPRAAQTRRIQFTRVGQNQIREKLAGDPSCDRLVICALEGDLFFGAEPEIEKHLSAIERMAKGGTRVVILNVAQARNPDAAFLNLFTFFLEELHDHGVALLLSGVQEDLSKALASTGLDKRLGDKNIFRDGQNGPSLREAVRSAYAILGDNLCATCPRRLERPSSAHSLDFVI